jgi:hypothetical protein
VRGAYGAVEGRGRGVEMREMVEGLEGSGRTENKVDERRSKERLVRARRRVERCCLPC